MEHIELADEIKEQARKREAEGELAESAEGGSAALSLDDLDGAAGGMVRTLRKVVVLGPMAGLDGE